jgi:hypothetical protein
MKLLNILSITTMGVLFAAGCSSTSVVTTDGGGTETGGTDTGVKVDTGAGADTGVKADTGGDAGDPAKACQDCVTEMCSSEVAACNASDATKAGCKAIVDCLVACTTAACQNACISDSTSAEGKAFVQCVYIDKCQTQCTSPG